MPLLPRRKRLYASMRSTPHMRLNFENERNDDVMTHLSYGEAWQHLTESIPISPSMLEILGQGIVMIVLLPIINLVNPIYLIN